MSTEFTSDTKRLQDSKTQPEVQPSQTGTAEISRQQRQVVLILVGLIGSGKSTFAQALQKYNPRFLRCNQDDLGSRRRVEEIAHHQLQQGGSVCIDRTNIDASQRETWIRMAREYNGVMAWVLLFDTPFQVCEGRLRTRVGHPTITSLEQGISVLQRFRSQFQLPHANEGYERYLKLSPSQQPLEYSSVDITSILDRLEKSPPVVPKSWGLRAFSRGSPHRGPSSGSRSHGGYGHNRGDSSRSGRGGYSQYRGDNNSRSDRGSSQHSLTNNRGMRSRDVWQEWRTSNEGAS